MDEKFTLSEESDSADDETKGIQPGPPHFAPLRRSFAWQATGFFMKRSGAKTSRFCTLLEKSNITAMEAWLYLTNPRLLLKMPCMNALEKLPTAELYGHEASLELIDRICALIEDIQEVTNEHARLSLIVNGPPKRRGAPRRKTHHDGNGADDDEAYSSDNGGFSTDVMSIERERELLNEFWDLKQTLARKLLSFEPKLRAIRPTTEPHSIASFIEEAWKIIKPDSELRTVYASYHACRQTIAMANIRLVGHIAKKFRYRTGLAYSDIINAGVLGSMTAVDRFEVERDTRFATYATWWIRQQMQIAVAAEDTRFASSLSPHSVRDMAIINKYEEEYGFKNGHEPTSEEIAKGVGMSLEVVRGLRATGRKVSMQTAFRSNNEDALGDTLTEDGILSGSEHSTKEPGNSTLGDVERHDTTAVIDDMLRKHLRPREKKILELRFGLIDHEFKSLRAIGYLLRISKERVRQIIKRAIQKLRLKAADSLATLFGDGFDIETLAPVHIDDDDDLQNVPDAEESFI